MVLQADLEEVAEQADELPAPEDVYDTDEEIAVSELFDDAFVQEHTEFDSFDEMVQASPSDGDSADELETVPGGAWDEFVAETTAFDDETAFVFAARDNWVGKKLNLA